MTVRVALAVAALAGASTFAQQAKPPAQPRQVEIVRLQGLQRADVPEPPAGENAWSLLIHTTGGFTGRGVGSVTISSDGRMACGSAPCATPVSATRLQPVTAMIAAVVSGPWIRQAQTGICRDCVHTIVALKRREGGLVRVYWASWDDTQATTPELGDLRRLALDLRTQRASR